MVRNACIPAFGQMQAGQDLVLAGCIALWGTSRLASVGEERLKERFTPRFIRRCQEIGGFHAPRNASAQPHGAAPERAASWRLCGII